MKRFAVALGGFLLLVNSSAWADAITRQKAASFFEAAGFTFQQGKPISGSENFVGERGADFVQLIGSKTDLPQISHVQCFSSDIENGIVRAVFEQTQTAAFFFPKWKGAGEWVAKAIFKDSGDEITQGDRTISYRLDKSTICTWLTITKK